MITVNNVLNVDILRNKKSRSQRQKKSRSRIRETEPGEQAGEEETGCLCELCLELGARLARVGRHEVDEHLTTDGPRALVPLGQQVSDPRYGHLRIRRSHWLLTVSRDRTVTTSFDGNFDHSLLD